ncbi:MAG TPA: DUF6152 family protein [Steroidobacteraceae bacterium]|jgi:hypothetical protein|nr:DUF6152 family protein [Steroidobacteraceae bacterium]
MKIIINVALASALSLSALPALAHHSASMFEPVKTVTVSGTVKEFQYTNPHAWLLVEVPGAGGSVTTWSFEMGELSFLTRAGIHRQDFMPGTKVTITGHPMKDGRTAGSFTKAVRADGEIFTARGKVSGSANQPN